MSIKDTVVSAVGSVVGVFTGLSQAENQRSKAPKVITPGMPELLRNVAAQGAVLLKNDGTLPFKKDSTVSLFGRVQKDWFFTGYGSGGDVNKPYAVNLIDGIRNCDSLKLNEKLAEIYLEWCKENPVNHGIWGQWPRFYPEMPLYEKTAKKAAEKSDYAVVVIGRSSGEDRENALEKGSYYITDEELELLDKVTTQFDKTVVLLNIGCIMDLGWMEKYGDKIGNFGGIDMDVVCRNSKEEIREYIRDVIAKCQGHGGFAFGTGNSIPDYIPTENYVHMIEETIVSKRVPPAPVEEPVGLFF